MTFHKVFRDALIPIFGLIIGLVYSNNCKSALDASILLHIEEPASGKVTTKSGVGNIRGWAISQLGIDRVELYIDGVFQQNIPYGSKRQDVCDVYSENVYSGACFSGYSNTFYYGSLDVGVHTILLRAYNSAGDHNDVSIDFNVVSFGKNYIHDDTRIKMNASSSALISSGKNSFIIESVTVDGKCYDIGFKWNTPSQSWSVNSILDSESNCDL